MMSAGIGADITLDLARIGDGYDYLRPLAWFRNYVQGSSQLIDALAYAG